MIVSLPQAGLSLAAGSLTTLSPCVFPLLPLVLGGAMQANRLAPVAMGVGMALSFAAIGMLLGAFGPALGIDGDTIRIAGAVAVAALALAHRLARPGAPLRGPAGALAGVVLAIALLALGALAGVPSPDRWGEVTQSSAALCAGTIAGLSLPALLAGFLAMRGLAPTRPRLAGAALGLLAGALGALAYALICPVASPVFVALWYSAAMVGPSAVGALLGPRVLRW